MTEEKKELGMGYYGFNPPRSFTKYDKSTTNNRKYRLGKHPQSCILHGDTKVLCHSCGKLVCEKCVGRNPCQHCRSLQRRRKLWQKLKKDRWPKALYRNQAAKKK